MHFPALQAIGLSLSLAAALPSCAAPADGPPRPNVMLVVLDDVGTDGVRAYGDDPEAPPTANIDALAASGMLFRQAWANPTCTPSRASLLSGELPRTSGVGSIPNTNGGLPTGHRSIATDLKAAGYRTFALGKWHVATARQISGHPRSLGFDYFAGTRGNIAQGKGGGEKNYFEWTKWFEKGTVNSWKKYATTDTIDDALAQIDGSEPWFGYVALHAAHFPSHVPPVELHSYSEALRASASPLLAFRAAIEAADRELGRLLAALPENTLLFVLSDNGSPEAVTTSAAADGRAKKTTYQAGIRVPLIVHGPGVAHGEVRGPVHLTDVFATILDWLELPGPPPADSISFADALRGGAVRREWMISEQFGRPSVATSAILHGCLKLLHLPDGTRELFDLCVDPGERHDLLGPDGRPPAEIASEVAELERRLAFEPPEVAPPRAGRRGGLGAGERGRAGD